MLSGVINLFIFYCRKSLQFIQQPVWKWTPKIEEINASVRYTCMRSQNKCTITPCASHTRASKKLITEKNIFISNEVWRELWYQKRKCRIVIQSINLVKASLTQVVFFYNLMNIQLHVHRTTKIEKQRKLKLKIRYDLELCP